MSAIAKRVPMIPVLPAAKEISNRPMLSQNPQAQLKKMPAAQMR